MGRRLVALGIGMVLAPVLGAGTAGAATSWAIQSTPNPKGAMSSSLLDDSCPSIRVCVAVGNYKNSSGIWATLAERWNGASWVIQSTPTPKSNSGSFLNGVSCSSANACTAVGQYYLNRSSVLRTLAERWNGTSWAIQSTPTPDINDGGSVLSGVSCPSANACTAVGYSGESIAERWNGTSWRVQTTATPKGAMFSLLADVSCPSANDCTAAGSYGTDHETTLVEHWNGTTWAIDPTPNPSEHGSAVIGLSWVSCPSATFCVAVGFFATSLTALQMTLAERWNGSRWSIQTTANPKVGGSNLSGVSCHSTRSCVAVGYHDGTALAEGWNGTSWSVQATPSPKGSDGDNLLGVSCPSADACVAVGNYGTSSGGDATLAEGS